jgi:DNA ligase-1
MSRPKEKTQNMKDTLFSDLAALCDGLERTRKRKEIARLVGEFLKGLPPDEVRMAVSLILGRAAPAKPLDASGASVTEILPALAGKEGGSRSATFPDAPDFGEAVRVFLEKSGFAPSGNALTIKSVSRAFEAVAETKGAGSRKKKRELLLRLLAAATPPEAKYIIKNVIGEMRHGVDEGMVLEALSFTLGVDIDLLRRAAMLTGDVGETARTALSGGGEGLRRTGLTLFRPVKPMLAEPAQSMGEVFEAMQAPFALEYKLDGVRVQIHKKGETCRLFSRNLADITESFPEVAGEVNRTLAGTEAVLEGEVIAVDGSGAPLPFQVLGRRLGRVRDRERLMREIPVRLALFDILEEDGKVLIDLPYEERWKALEKTSLPLVPRVIPAGRKEGEAFFQKAVNEGYEGLVAKSLAAPYTPGVRGRAWMKIKKVLSLDLVIIAAEWGYGRRHGWLSNYLLAARDERTGAFLPVGKTFKGLTDKEFREMTERLLALKTGEGRWAVSVRPEVVVEVLFSDVQQSPHYESGFALRFARIARIRDDKPPREIDSVQTIEALSRRQIGKERSAA